MKAIRYIVAGLMLTAAAGGAWAQADSLINGKAWLQSTERERMAFIVGVTSMIAVEKAYAERKGTPQPPAGERLAQRMGDLTVEQIADRITRWYEANPDRHETPVMKAVWLEIVRSGTARR